MGKAPRAPTTEGAAVAPTNPNSQVGLAVAVECSASPVGTLVGDASLSFRPQLLEPASSDSNRHIPSGSHVNPSTPTSPLEGSDLEDDDVTMFLNFEAEEDVQLSTDRTKKRRLEEGDASSPSQSNI